MARDVARDWMWSEACEMLARAERMHRELFRPAGTQARQRRPGSRRSIFWRLNSRFWRWSLCPASTPKASKSLSKTANWSSPASRDLSARRCAPRSFIAWNCRRAAFTGGCACRPVVTAAVRRAVADGCLVITLQKGSEPWLKSKCCRQDGAGARRFNPAAAAAGCADHRAGAQHRAVSRPRAADHARPAEVDRRRATGGARSASGRHPAATRRRGRPIRARSTCIAWVRSPTSCATSPRRTARIT